MKVWQVALAVVLPACNALYGVDDTGLRPSSDIDHDGIVDAEDNCPFTPNPGQGDGDLDTVGDACDPCADGQQTGVDNDGDGVDDGCDICLTGANHDEDLDDFADGCDVCPAVPDSQADVDGDGVGDACDPDPATMQHRVFFDGFGPPRSDWNQGFTPWHATDDGYAPDDASMGNPVEGPWNPNAVVVGRGVRVVASIAIPSAALIPDFQFLGVNLRRRSDGRAIEGCTISVQGAQWEALGNPDPIAAGSWTFTLDFHPAANAMYVNVGCAVAGRAFVNTNVAFDPSDAYVPSLLTSVPAEVEWIDVLE